MIPRAIEMIFKVSGHLQDRGWKYSMEGQFLEVYNEVVSSRSYSKPRLGGCRWMMSIADTCRSMIYLGVVSLIPRNMKSNWTGRER